jgi:ABC-type phosphate transport system substrate-binding protein
MKPNSSRILMGLLVLAVAALVAGCGGGTSTGAASAATVENPGSTSSTPTTTVTSTVANDPAAVARAVISLVQNGDCRARIYNGDPGALTAYGELKVALEENRTRAIRRLTDKVLRQVADYC